MVFDPKKRADGSQENYDLSEAASQQSDEESTRIARQLESDDIKPGGMEDTNGDDWAENKIATSIDED